MSFEQIKGQAQAVGLLESALSSGRLAHAVLLAGPEGVGKRKAAYGVARALLCENGPSRACGGCPSCHRVDAGTHADLYVVRRDAGRSAVAIDQVRDLSRRLAETPMEGTRKAAIIEAADSMTVQAQNSLLKTLEEPPADTTILLVAENTDLLLPTLRSRCRRVNFTPVADEIIAEFLVEAGMPADSAQALAPVARGSFSRALSLLEDSTGEGRRRLVESLASLEPAKADDVADMIASGRLGGSGKGRMSMRERREGAARMLGTLHSFLVACLRIKAAAKAGRDLDLEREARAFAEAREFDEIVELEKEVADAIILLGMYADVRLVAGRVASAFSRVRSKDRV